MIEAAVRKFLKIIKWLFVITLILFVFLLVSGWYLLATDSGYRKIPSLVNQFTPYTLSYATLDGHLFKEQHWTDVELQGPSIDVNVAELVIDIQTAELWDKRLHLQQFSASNGKVVLLSSEQEKSKPQDKGIPSELPQIDLPIAVDIDHLALNDIAIWQKNVQLTTIKQAQLSAHYTEQTLTVDAAADITQGYAKLNGEVKTLGDYPLNIEGRANIGLTENDEQIIILQADKSLLQPNVTLQLNGQLNTKIQLTGAIDLQARMLDLRAIWDDLDYQQQYESEHGVVKAEGAFEDFAINVTADVGGGNLPPIDLSAHAQVSDHGIEDAYISAKLLGGEVRFVGDVQYQPSVTWDGVLSIDDIVAQRYYQDINGDINGEIITSGKRTDGELTANLKINALTGQWQGQPIEGQGGIVYENDTLAVDDLQLNLAGNHISANGSMVDEALDIELAIDADHLDRLLPGVTGRVNGDVHVHDNIHNPNFTAALSWQDLRYKSQSSEAKPQSSADSTTDDEVMLRSERGRLSVEGPLSSMAIDLQAQLETPDIPPSEVALTANASPQKITDIDLHVDTLEGEIAATGEVELSPQISWALDAKVSGVEAGAYVEGLDGNISAVINSEGSIVDGQVSMQTQVNNLDGQWQGSPLSGQADIAMEDGQLAVKSMDMTIGDNRLDLTGDLNPDALDVQFNIDGQSLSKFHPDLDGRISGKGQITGTADAPIANVHLQGQQVRYKDNSAATVAVDIDSSMVDGGAFNNHIELSNVDLAGQQWQRIVIDTNGTFNQHTLEVHTAGGSVNVDLAANGGFTAIDSWAGSLKDFSVTGYDLNWRMKNTTELAVSPQKITLDDFCLVDAYSTICLDLQKEENTSLSYRIDPLDSRSFAQFLPQRMRIEPKVQGDGSIEITSEGDINGNADLTFTPGILHYQPQDAPPVTLVLEQGQLNSRFSQGVANMNLDVVFQDAGEIRGQANISDFSQPSVTGEVNVNVPDISKFQYFIPKVSELRGNIAGSLRFSGRLPEPQVTGELILDNGAVTIPEYATELQDIYLRLSAVQTGQINIDGNIGTPQGDLIARGRIQLSPVAVNLDLRGQNMLIANSNQARLLISPDIHVTVDPNTGVDVGGEVFIPEALIAIPDRSEAVQVSDDVVILTGEEKRDDIVPIEQNSPLRAEVNIKLGDEVYFQAPQATLRLIGGIDVIALPGQPIKGRGVIEVENGIYELYGQELDIRRGRITFTGNDITNPVVDVLALREIDDVEAGAQITGTAQNLALTLTSDPTLPDSAILSYLLFGRPPDSAMDNEALLQTAASISLGGVFPNDLAEQTGLDKFDLGVTGLKAGKYLGEDMYVGVRSNFFTAITQFVARYEFNERLSAEATAQANESAIDFLYEFETN